MAEPTTEHALVRATSLPRPAEWEVLRESSYLVAKTAFALQWSHRPENIMAAMLQGRELGIGPMAAVLNIHVIDGRPSASAELQLALIRREGHKVNVVKWTKETCILKGTRADTGDEAEVEFSLEDAKTAGLYPKKDNWSKYPKPMMWARTVSMLATALFSDVTLGLKTADELGAETEEDGQTIVPSPDVPADYGRAPQRPKPAAAAPQAATPIEGTAVDVTPEGETVAPSATVSAEEQQTPAPPRGRADASQEGTLPVARNPVQHSATAPPAPAPPPTTADERTAADMHPGVATAEPVREPARPGDTVLSDGAGAYWLVPAGLTSAGAIPLPPYPDRTCSKCIEEGKVADGADSGWKAWADKGEARWMCANGHLARKPRNWEGAAPAEEPGPAEAAEVKEGEAVPPVEAAAAPSDSPAAATESSSPEAASPSPASAAETTAPEAFGFDAAPPPAPPEPDGLNMERVWVLKCAVALKRTQLEENNRKLRLDGQDELAIPSDAELLEPGRAALLMYLRQVYGDGTELKDLDAEQLQNTAAQLLAWIQQRGGTPPEPQGG